MINSHLSRNSSRLYTPLYLFSERDFWLFKILGFDFICYHIDLGRSLKKLIILSLNFGNFCYEIEHNFSSSLAQLFQASTKLSLSKNLSLTAKFQLSQSHLN